MYFLNGFPGGRGGRRAVEMIADVTMPNIASVIRIRVTRGRLCERTVAPNSSPPRMIGNHPSKNIKSEFVPHDQNPSSWLNVKKNFFARGISGSFKNANSG